MLYDHKALGIFPANSIKTKKRAFGFAAFFIYEIHTFAA